MNRRSPGGRLGSLPSSVESLVASYPCDSQVIKTSEGQILNVYERIKIDQRAAIVADTTPIDKTKLPTPTIDRKNSVVTYTYDFFPDGHYPKTADLIAAREEGFHNVKFESKERPDKFNALQSISLMDAERATVPFHRYDRDNKQKLVDTDLAAL